MVKTKMMLDCREREAYIKHIASLSFSILFQFLLLTALFCRIFFFHIHPKCWRFSTNRWQRARRVFSALSQIPFQP